MKRIILTEKLRRIASTIDSNNTPIPFMELWVYGSYARGALECNDLDLIASHEKITSGWLKKHTNLTFADRYTNKYIQIIKSSLIKKNERVDLRLEQGNESIQYFFKTIPVNDAIRIWSIEDRNWEKNINSIQINPNAKSFERNYPIDLKRTKTGRYTMEELQWLISTQKLEMEVKKLNDLEGSFPQSSQIVLERMQNFRGINRESMKIVPFVYKWMKSEGETLDEDYSSRCTKMKSHEGNCFAYIGKFDFHYASLKIYEKPNECRKVCFIAHLRKKSENNIFIIKKGKKWTGKYQEDIQDFEEKMYKKESEAVRDLDV